MKKSSTSNRSGNRPPKAGARTTAKPTRQRWLYDVRQYAILTDDDGKLLILQLPKTYDTSAANTWTLPGGRLEPTDNPAEGVLREIKEETGFEAVSQGPCAVGRWSSRNSRKLAIFYRATVAGRAPLPHLSGEHQRAFWITLDELKDYPFHRKDMVEIIHESLESK